METEIVIALQQLQMKTENRGHFVTVMATGLKISSGTDSIKLSK
jgi:hypothetical protein